MHRRLAPLLLLALVALPALADEDPLAPPRTPRRATPAEGPAPAPPPPADAPAPPPADEPADEPAAQGGDRGDRKDDGDRTRQRALNLSNRIGLTGFGDLIDARVPSDTIALRGGLRYRAQVSEQEVEGGDQTLERHELPIYLGASLFGHFDAGLRATYLVRDEEIDVHGGPDDDLSEDGWADIDVGAKVALDLSLVWVGAYVQGRIPLDHDVSRLGVVDVGLTGTFAVWGDRIGLHGNLGAVFVEEGTQALRYRLGASFVALATDFLTLRAFAYVDGLEFEGTPNSDLDLELGAQAILFGFLTAELSVGTRLVDSGYVDDDLRDALDAAGLYDRSTDDTGTWEVELSAGLQFAF